MNKLVILILIALSFSQAFEICSTKGTIQYYCEDGYGCCSDTTCGLYCSGGGSGSGGGFPWYGYLLIGIGALLLIACITICTRMCKKQQRQRQQQQQLLQP
ncbi:hypothetical protein ABPG72_000450 [Tetrahymena utriculariae]